MTNGNKIIMGLAIAGVIAVGASLSSLNQGRGASAIVSPVEINNAAAAPEGSEVHTAPAPAPAAQATKLSTLKNIVFLNTQVDEYSVNEIITRLQTLEGSKEPVYLLIDSPGGSVFDGARLITQMESMKTPVNTVCVGLCASMGAMIHSYGKQRLITARSTLMYHPASGGAQGQIPNMLARLNYAQNFVGKLEANVQKRSGMAKADYEKRIAYEFWADSDEAKALKLVDNVVALNVTLPAAKADSRSPEEDNRNRRRRGGSLRDFDLIWIYDGSVSK
jgi:ATP-dependent Clp protease protease subunit